MPSWSEKELEDWLCEEGRFVEALENEYIDHDEDSLLFRQVSCPAGIMDMVLVGRDHVIIAELKSEQAGPPALCQLLRYTGYARWRHLCLSLRLDGGRTIHADNAWESEKYVVRGVLIAPSFDDSVMWAVQEIPCVHLVAVTTAFSVDTPSFSRFNSDGNNSCRRECMDDPFDIAWARGVERHALAEIVSNEQRGR